MKTIKRILILIAVLICCSCEKESHWLCHTYGAADPLGSHKTYRTYLNEEEKSFMLNEGDYDSRVIYRGKVIDFDHATLTWYENDKEISITIKASRYE